MTIEKRYGKKAAFYAILDDKGGILAHFDTLEPATIVLRFMSGLPLSDGDCVRATEAIRKFDIRNTKTVEV